MYFERFFIKIIDFIYYYFGLSMVEEKEELNTELLDKYNDL